MVASCCSETFFNSSRNAFNAVSLASLPFPTAAKSSMCFFSMSSMVCRCLVVVVCKSCSCSFSCVSNLVVYSCSLVCHACLSSLMARSCATLLCSNFNANAFMASVAALASCNSCLLGNSVSWEAFHSRKRAAAKLSTLVSACFRACIACFSWASLSFSRSFIACS